MGFTNLFTASHGKGYKVQHYKLVELKRSVSQQYPLLFFQFPGMYEDPGNNTKYINLKINNIRQQQEEESFHSAEQEFACGSWLCASVLCCVVAAQI